MADTAATAVTSLVADWTASAAPDDNNNISTVCSQLNAIVAHSIDTINAGSSSGGATVNQQRHIDVTRVINDFLVPTVALFGIVGNALNLAVLTRKRLQRTMDRLEKSAHAGLVALAVSDALVCVTYVLASLMRDRMTYSDRRAQFVALYFNAYREPLLNVFLLSSTWLTVVMAVGRYVAVCRPLHARGFISLRGTWIAIAVVFLGSVGVNAPRFWHYVPTAKPCWNMVPAELRAEARTCVTDCTYYVKLTGALYDQHKTFVFVYGIVCFAVGIFIPLPILTACNVCLARALRRSRMLQKQCRASRAHEMTGRRSNESQQPSSHHRF